jgi:drug/metabolite transporter (DMT)-like permease
VAAVALLLFLPAARRHWSWRTPLVGCAYAGTLILFVTANKLTTSAATIFLQSTAPLYLLLLGPWLLHEKVRKRDAAVIVALATGLVMMVWGSDTPQTTAPDPLRGNILAAVSGIFWALTIGGLRWLGRTSHEAAASATAVGNLIGFVVCLPFALPLASVSAPDVMAIVYLGVFQIGLAYAFVTRGVTRIGALEASLLLLLEPVLNPFWAWLVQGEVPGRWTVAGGALILAATLVQATKRD